MLRREEVRQDRYIAFLRQAICYGTLPVSQPEYFVDDDHRRRLGLSLGIGDVRPNGVAAPFDRYPLTMGSDRIISDRRHH
jgi:hypothetical protein